METKDNSTQTLVETINLALQDSEKVDPKVNVEIIDRNVVNDKTENIKQNSEPTTEPTTESTTENTTESTADPKLVGVVIDELGSWSACSSGKACRMILIMTFLGGLFIGAWLSSEWLKYFTLVLILTSLFSWWRIY